MPAPHRLVNPEEDEEEDGDEPDGVDTDTFLQQLAGACTYMNLKSTWYAEFFLSKFVTILHVHVHMYIHVY